MSKKYYILLGAIILILSTTVSLSFPSTKNYLNSIIATTTKTSTKCKTVQSTTFLKSYRVKDMTDTFGIYQTTDGGYIIAGHTVNHNELCGYSMFWIKTDKNGSKEWSKLFHNCSSDGYAITQLTDGNYVAAGQVVDFRTDEEQENLEGQGDNFVVKIDTKGNPIWSRTVSQQSIDAAYKLAPTSTGGFIMSGTTGALVGQADVADIEHVSFLGNFDTNGNTNWFKKIESTENMTKSAKQTKDGGYILIGNVKLIKENDQKVPAIVKLKKTGAYEWATGLENLPIEIPITKIVSKSHQYFCNKVILEIFSVRFLIRCSCSLIVCLYSRFSLSS